MYEKSIKIKHPIDLAYPLFTLHIKFNKTYTI